jgi:hypothetical protein
MKGEEASDVVVYQEKTIKAALDSYAQKKNTFMQIQESMISVTESEATVATTTTSNPKTENTQTSESTSPQTEEKVPESASLSN